MIARAAIVASAILLLAGCASDKVPNLPAPVSFCDDYQPVRIIEAAARAMIAAGDAGELQKNAANNVHWHEKCALDNGRAKGPR